MEDPLDKDDQADGAGGEDEPDDRAALTEERW